MIKIKVVDTKEKLEIYIIGRTKGEGRKLFTIGKSKKIKEGTAFLHPSFTIDKKDKSEFINSLIASLSAEKFIKDYDAQASELTKKIEDLEKGNAGLNSLLSEENQKIKDLQKYITELEQSKTTLLEKLVSYADAIKDSNTILIQSMNGMKEIFEAAQQQGKLQGDSK